MKTLIQYLCILSVCTVPLYATPPAIDYSFWLGKWEVSWDEGQGKTGQGVNTITSTLDGKVIQEEFEITSGQSKGFKGKSMSIYHAYSKSWKQSWVDNSGGYYSFTGGVDKEGNPTFITAPTKIGDDTVISRMVFKNISSDSLTWDWEGSKDGGLTWALNWRIHYKKLEVKHSKMPDDFELLMGTCQCLSEQMQANGQWQAPINMRWTFEPIMGGSGVQDEFDLDSGLHGGSIRQYNAQEKKWYVHYYSNQAASPKLQSWEGSKNENGDIVLYSPQPSASGEPGFLKLRFYEMSDKGYKWIGAWVNEDESTKNPFWKIACTRD